MNVHLDTSYKINFVLLHAMLIHILSMESALTANLLVLPVHHQLNVLAVQMLLTSSITQSVLMPVLPQHTVSKINVEIVPSINVNNVNMMLLLPSNINVLLVKHPI